MICSFIFPGQGSQTCGMGLELAQTFTIARETFQEIDESLHQNLSRIIFEGPETTLSLTENAQPAILAVSMAVIRILRTQGGMVLENTAKFVAGHSLGEYSALWASDALTLRDAAQLVKYRGQAMQQAVPVGEGTMLVLLGTTRENAQNIVQAAQHNDICTIANENALDQIVISGHTAAIQRAKTLASEYGVKRTVQLPVSAPFHCPLMESAARSMASYLEQYTIQPPKVPVISNVTARPVEEPRHIRQLLQKQMTHPVLWYQTMLFLQEQNVDTFVECGSGKVLTGLVRKFDHKLASYTLNRPHDIDHFLEKVQ